MAVPRDARQVTSLLQRWQGGDAAALGQLVDLVYEDLRRAAHRLMRQERRNHTLQTSALINEAYLRLVDQRRSNWNDRSHFFAVAAQIMRRILVDHARARSSAKRGASAVHVTIDEIAVVAPERDSELIALDDALAELAKRDARKARVVELRYFAGLTTEEIAELLGIAPVTVMRDWSFARAWLRRAMGHHG